MRLLLLLWASLGTSCVMVEDVAFVLRTPVGGPTDLRYTVELFRGGSCPSALDAIAGMGSGGTRIESRTGTRDTLQPFSAIEEGDFVVIAIGTDSSCIPTQFGCTAFRTGDGADVVVTLGDSGFDPGTNPCGDGMVCQAGTCVVDTSMCVDIAPVLPERCTREAECGPPRAFDCTDSMCVPKPPAAAALELDITRGTMAEVVGERFALAEQGLDYVHVLAAVRQSTGGSRSLEVWTAAAGDLSAGTTQPADAAWTLDQPYAVAARDYGGTLHVVAYHEEKELAALHVGTMDGATMQMPSIQIVNSTPRSGTPAFTGTGENLRQFWFGEGPGSGPAELASLDRNGGFDSPRVFTDPELPDFSARNEIIGSRGDYALLESRSEGFYFIAYSDPNATGGRMTVPAAQVATLDGITDRPAFVHMGGDRYALMYPAGGSLNVRYATCVLRVCTFDDTYPEPIPFGTSISLLRAEALFDGGTHVGFALASLRHECDGTPRTELILLDTDLVPRYQVAVDSEPALDVELAVVDDGTSWRVYVARLRSHPTRNQDIWLTAFDY
jgi:hypothetical protein